MSIWHFRVREIGTPSLVQIRVAFQIVKDGADFAPDEIILSPTELDGKNNADKLAYIAQKIKNRIAPYITTDMIAQGLQSYVGQVFLAT